MPILEDYDWHVIEVRKKDIVVIGLFNSSGQSSGTKNRLRCQLESERVNGEFVIETPPPGRVSRSSEKFYSRNYSGSSSHLSLVVVEDAPEWGCEGIGLESVVGDLINYFQMECGK
ncbi:hypothetical protein CEXT_628321 [Caerostris extrusa]|uniref:Uncharacterized protein n=1 Tax=Caerostris extrusa TaxID=172846 RepID=A0AAV4W3I4_CAEEX|nr:hypothetical protein CEXT_628321 [Caerostris extrusa]